MCKEESRSLAAVAKRRVRRMRRSERSPFFAHAPRPKICARTVRFFSHCLACAHARARVHARNGREWWRRGLGRGGGGGGGGGAALATPRARICVRAFRSVGSGWRATDDGRWCAKIGASERRIARVRAHCGERRKRRAKEHARVAVERAPDEVADGFARSLRLSRRPSRAAAAACRRRCRRRRRRHRRSLSLLVVTGRSEEAEKKKRRRQRRQTPSFSLSLAPPPSFSSLSSVGHVLFCRQVAVGDVPAATAAAATATAAAAAAAAATAASGSSGRRRRRRRRCS